MKLKLKHGNTTFATQLRTWIYIFLSYFSICANQIYIPKTFTGQVSPKNKM